MPKTPVPVPIPQGRQESRWAKGLRHLARSCRRTDDLAALQTFQRPL
jgi:hypothetical protein